MAVDVPSGFRFYPTEEELVTFYLRNLLEGRNREEIHRVIPIIDIYEKEPRDLQRLAGELCQNDTEQWFFFVPRQDREARGGRLRRTTCSGYWKATGSPGYVYSTDDRVIGLKKSMVFYSGRTPNGRKTKWKMNEYKSIETITPHQNNSQAIPKLRHEYSLCRVYVVSGASRAFDRRPADTIYPLQQTHYVVAELNAPVSSGGVGGAFAAGGPENSTLEVPLTMSNFEEAMELNWEQFDQWLQ